MIALPTPLPRRELRFPARSGGMGKLGRWSRMLFGLAALPFNLSSALLGGAPGMKLRVRCMWLAFRAATAGDRRRAFSLFADPMDSFRYFELDFVERGIGALKPERYLDVSSPRLTALSIVDRHPDLIVDMVNPISADLDETMALAASLGLAGRIRLKRALIEEAGYAAESFDLVTCISVLEHIPDDRGAVEEIWRVLKPGGRAVFTVPCAREAADEYTNLDEYELFDKDQQGMVFWQRYYDPGLLERNLFSVMGLPVSTKLYGERKAGLYDANVYQKRTRSDYPFWRESRMMARDFGYFDRIETLPGMAVIGMTFEKPEKI